MIQPQRIQLLNRHPPRPGEYVLYWMQQAQRERYNHALEYAIHRANGTGRPLLVVFVLTTTFPMANLRHYSFMLQGLRETQQTLADRKIKMIIRQGLPQTVISQLAVQACLVVTDRGYLQIQRRWRIELARQLMCPFIQVESDVIVPVETASVKEEYSAGTFRPRISRLLARFLVPVRRNPVKHTSLGIGLEGMNISDPYKVASCLDINLSVPPVIRIEGGAEHAAEKLNRFLKKKLKEYAGKRNQPEADCQSHLSPYLHFGQISSLDIALQARQTGMGAVFLEELIVRRELSMNFVFYNPYYDSYACLPRWAANTLNNHKSDPRMAVYFREELEQAATDDPYWNAAQQELLCRGEIHNYMRMYWGKKILQWSRSPREAFETALYLNNKYALDGRDPNSFAGVAWCFGKHDRAWGERPVFGKVRYMSSGGLKRKFRMEQYLEKTAGNYRVFQLENM